MLRNISNLLPKIIYILCGVAISIIYMELFVDRGLGEQGNTARRRPRNSQNCKCEEVLETIRALQEKTLKVERDLLYEKSKLKILLQRVEDDNPSEYPKLRIHETAAIFGGGVIGKPHGQSQSNSKLPIWSFTPKYFFQPSLRVHSPMVAADKIKDAGMKRTVKNAFTQICWHFKSRFRTKTCELVHGSLGLDLTVGLRLAFVIKLKRREPAFVKVDGLFKVDKKFSLKNANVVVFEKELHIITMISDAVPLSRLKNFLGMLKMLKRRGEVLYVYFSIFANERNSEIFRACIMEQSRTLNYTFVKISHVKHKFDRAYARHHGVSLLPKKDTLIVFADIDITFDDGFLQRCQSYTQAGKSVYFPIVFSMYNPIFYPRGSNNTFVVSRKKGFWRTTGLGNLCVYKSDYFAVGGFNTNITGWGSEDDDLYERFLAHESVTVFRFPDHGIFHRWHPKKCDLTTQDEMRWKRCLSTKFMFEASHEDLAAEYFKHKEK